MEACFNARPRKRGVRRQPPGAQGFVAQEMGKLQEAQAMRGERRPECLVSQAIAPGERGKVRMCVDIAGLNRAGTRGLFWPPHVSLSRGVAAGHVRMPFGLRNASETFQRLAQLVMAPRETPGPREPSRPQEPTGP